VWTLIWAVVVAGCARSSVYRGRVLICPAVDGLKLDAFGDPLPTGASQRLGTGRFHHANFIRWIAYSPDGKTIASWGGDMRCRFWDAASGRLLWATPTTYRMPTFMPGGRYVALCYGTDVHLVRLTTGKIVHTFQSHRREITWMGFAADGGRLVTLSNDRTIRVWGMLLAIEVRKIELGRVGVQSLNVVALSPDGRRLAISPAYSKVLVYDLDRGNCAVQIKTPAPAWVTSLAFSPDGKTIWGKLHDSKTLFWDARSGRKCEGTAPVDRPGAFAVSPDLRTVAYATGARIRLEDLRTGKELPVTARMRGHDRGPTMIAFAADGETLISAESNDVRQWDLKTGRDRPVLTARNEQWAVLSPDGRLAASLSGAGLVGVYDVAAGKRVALIEPGVTKITGVAFSGDSRTIVTASRESIGLWNVPAGTQRRSIALPAKKYLAVTAPVLSADGKLLVAVCSRPNPRRNDSARLMKVRAASHALPQEVRCIEVFDVPAGKSRGRIPGTIFALAPNSRTLAKPGNNCVELWDLTTVKPTASLKCTGGLLSSAVGATMQLRFSPDGRMLARAFIPPITDGKWNLGGNGRVELFDLAGGKSRMLRVDDISGAPALVFSPDSRTLATLSANSSILLWDVASGK